MAEFPLNLIDALGSVGAFFIYGLIGFAFGWILESAGFGNSCKLAAQFYFKELTVLKVMFTAIITAMTLIFAASALGLLDINLIWVPPTYVWPGVFGGLLMGVGFIVGGFCPGTSLVAAATLKIDGLFFVLGALFGILVFGETVGIYEPFFHSSFLGRLTLDESLGVDTGILVVVVVAAALLIFYGAEWVEQRVGGIERQQAPRWRYGAAALLLAMAAGVAVIGQPDNERRWATLETLEEARLNAREVQVDPLEVLSLMHDSALRITILDLRDEYAYNRFHLRDAQRIADADLDTLAETLIAQPANTVTILTGAHGDDANEVWRYLRAESVPNLYILDGGVDAWLARFHSEALPAVHPDHALGSRHPAADPNPRLFEGDFEPKVKLRVKRAPTSGGCA